MSSSSHLRFPIAKLVAFLAFLPFTASAGQPLICHPYAIGDAVSLPVSANGGTSPTYDRRQLVDDTMALLTPETPLLVRMETLRRAAIYATANLRGWGKGVYTAEDRAIATNLLAKLRERTRHATKPALTLALFDLGFYSETLRQAGVDPALDGYDLLVRASEMSGGNPTMEFALALASSYPRRPEQPKHLAKARAAAAQDPALVANLASHFGKS